MLQKAGWGVQLAENGVVALDKLGQKGATPDALIVDLMMPEMDGFTLIDRLRGQPELRHLPIIVLTAKELTAEDRSRLTASVQRIFQKGSYNRRELLEELRHQLVSATVRNSTKSIAG